MRTTASLLVPTALALCACSGGDGKAAGQGGTSQASVTGPAPAEAPPPLEPLPLGLPSIDAFASYGEGKGGAEYLRGAKAHHDKDWATAQAALEAAIAADAGHLHAHRLVASVLAQRGRDRDVGRHLAVALAGDWARWGPALEEDRDLTRFLATPHGTRVKELNAAYRDEYARRIRGALLVVGQQRPRRYAEVYAWNRESGRFLRLSRTSGKTAGWLPLGPDTVATVSFTHVKKSPPALLMNGRVALFDREEQRPPVRVTLPVRDLPALQVEVAPGGKLLVTGGDLLGPDVKLARSWEADPATGKVSGSKRTPGASTRLLVTPERAVLLRADDGRVEADWDGAGPLDAAAGSFRLAATKKTVTLPTGEYARRASFAWSPSGARVAFATRPAPCTAAHQPRTASLYVVDAATGKLRHVARGESGFDAEWVDDDLLAYEAEGGVVVLWNVTEAREVARLAARGGVGLHAAHVPPARCEEPAPEEDVEPGVEDGAAEGTEAGTEAGTEEE